MQYYLAQLKDFCEEHPLKRKVLIVPTMVAGHNLTMALAATGYTWLNLQIETPRSLAEKDVGARFISQGFSRLIENSDIFWLEDVLPAIVREVDNDYFSRQTTGLTRPLLRTLHSLRVAGVDPEELKESGYRHWLLKKLYRKYCMFFETEKVFDNAALYRGALAHLDELALDHEVQYAILDETPLPRLSFSYIERRTHGRLRRLGRNTIGALSPSHSARVRFQDIPIKEVGGDIGVAVSIFTPRITPEAVSEIRLIETVGAETEIRSVLRDARKNKLRLDDIEVVYTSNMPYTSLLCDIVQRFDLPATFGNGKPAELTRSGQALMSFYRWIGSGFSVDGFIEICRAGFVRSENTQSVATVIRKATGAIDPENYVSTLDKMKLRFKERDAEEDFREVGDEVEIAKDILQKIYNYVPKQKRLSAVDLIHAGQQFLAQNIKYAAGLETGSKTVTEDDHIEELCDHLERMADSVSQSGPVQILANLLADLVGDIRVQVEAAKPGHLSIAPLSSAGYTNRPYTYIIGMDEGAFPGGVKEDPLLLDGERAGLSSDLELLRTLPAEQVWHFERILSMAMGKVILLSCKQSLSGGRERFPSAIFQQVAEMAGVNQTDTEFRLPKLKALALDDSDLFLSEYPYANFNSEVGNKYPWMVTGQKAIRARRGQGLTTYDGWLGVSTPELAITEESNVLSVSKLERLAQCPYRFYLADVLGIKPVNDAEIDPTRWLDPMEFGALLHRVFHNFMRDLEAKAERPDRKQHTQPIQDILVAEVEAQKETIPVKYEAAYRSDLFRLTQAVQVFLAVESDQKDNEAIGFEVGFGEAGSLNGPDAFTVDLGENVSFRLQGRIDRVDRVADGHVIWDYKTGSRSQYLESDLLRRGTHLQWALYAYALEKILGQQDKAGKVSQSGYVFHGDREHGHRISNRPPDPVELANVLRPLFEMVAKGGFFHSQKFQECDYCVYSRVCGGERLDSSSLEEAIGIAGEEGDLPSILNSVKRWMET